MAASRTREFLLEVWQPHIVGTAVGIGLDVVAAAVVHVTDAAGAHFVAEGDFGGRIIVQRRPG
jgi:hypothetical protein